MVMDEIDTCITFIIFCVSSPAYMCTVCNPGARRNVGQGLGCLAVFSNELESDREI